MPRKPRVIEAGDEGEAGQPVQAATRPEGFTDQEWTIGGILGNLATATALLDVTSGKRAPINEYETASLMDAARRLEARSYKRYRTLKDNIGRKLADAKRDNMSHMDMIDALRAVEAYPDALVSQNGHSAIICAQGVDEADQGEPRDYAGDRAVEAVATASY